ncbi:MAG TPA: DUF1570 domain-containing protein [Kofleriaceae bacterium]|nr:DUF1570 domain-containing protein [Kofleriaceae bacterium]
MRPLGLGPGLGWLLAIAASAACAAVVPPLPSKGGPPWIEIQSAHFTLWTDAPPQRARELMSELEHHYQVIVLAMNTAPTKRSFVIALRDSWEVAAFLPRTAVASAWEADEPTRQPAIVLSAATQNRDHVISHELTHLISFGIIANQPHWLSEGIATYFEMAELDPGEVTVRIGVPRDDRAGYLHAFPPLPAAELFACRDHTCIDEAFYATSWAVVSFLLNEHFDELAHYFQRLNALPRDRQGETWARAWSEAFPDLPPDKLDRELREWLVTGKVRLPLIDVTVKDYPSTSRRLGDADALAVRSLLQLLFTHDVTAVRDQLAAAFTVDRTNVLARLVEAALMQAIAPGDARATAAAHPGDWRAWWLVAFAASQHTAAATAERRAALTRMCALTGDCGRAIAHRAPPPGAAAPSATP